MEIFEITYRITGTNSNALESKSIRGAFGVIDNLAEYIKEYAQYFKEHKPEFKTIGDAIDLVWEYAAYFCYCHIYTTTKKSDLVKEGCWFKDEICHLIMLLKKNGIELKDDWVYWQYAQVSLEAAKELRKNFPEPPVKDLLSQKKSEFEKRYTELAKKAVKNFDADADYEEKDCNTRFFKDTPATKSDWLDSNLKALKTFIATGKCDYKHFAFVLYQLLRTRDLGFPKPRGVDFEIDAVVRLSEFAAYINNRVELFANVDHYLMDSCYWFLRREQPGRTDLDTWGGLSECIAHSCGHKNYEGDLYTSIRSIDELNSWILLLGFFDFISPYEGFIVQRCFGYLFAPPSSTDALFFSGIVNKVVDKGSGYLKEHPGFVFCLYWMIHFLDEHKFNNVFLEDEKEVTPDNYCKKNGIVPIEKRHYKKNSLEILQLLLFFILFDLSSKFDQGYYEKKEALAPLMEKIKDESWHKKETILELYNWLGNKIHLKDSLGCLLEDCAPSDENIKSSILLVFNLSKFLRQDTKWLINEINQIKEIQNKKLRIVEHSKVYEDLKSDSLSENSEISNYKNHRKLSEIDTGFIVADFRQKIPNFKNLVLGRKITVKVFLDADVPTNYTDNKYYREQFRHLQNNKYAYFDRNMATHYATFSKVEDLLKGYNFADLLTSIYDLVHTDMSLKWYAMTNSEFRPIRDYPFYTNLLKDCLSRMEKFSKGFGACRDGVFADDGALIPNRDALKAIGNRFWDKNGKTGLRDKLRDCFNLLYCNSDLMKWYAECYGKDKQVERQSYADYDADFWTVYRYEIAVYLIKVAVELTALPA